MLILKHLRNLSDEHLAEQWRENVYYQYFCEENTFVAGEPSEPVHFREKIGEQGVELIVRENIRINGKDAQQDTVSIDTTVSQESK